MDFFNKVLSVYRDSKTGNISTFTVPAFLLLNMGVHIYAVGLTKGKFTNRSPRQFQSDMVHKTNKEAWERKYVRAEAASANGFESLGLFAGAVAVANIAKLPNAEINWLTSSYLLLRFIFAGLYIGTESETLAPLRSGAWLLSQIINGMLYFKAGYRINGW